MAEEIVECVMIDPEEAKPTSAFDQSAAWVAAHYPPFLRRFYLGCIVTGFTPAEAMTLTTHMLQTALRM